MTHPMHATAHLGYQSHCWSWLRERPTRPAGICRRSSRESGDRFDSGLGRLRLASLDVGEALPAREDDA